MRLATFTVAGTTHVGLAQQGGVVDLHDAATALGDDGAAALPRDVLGIIEAGPGSWGVAEALDERLASARLPEAGRDVWWWPEAEAKYDAPFVPRKNPWVIGANYLAHLAAGFARLGRAPVGPTHVEFFSKARASIIGDGDDIVYSSQASVTLDYECELAVVIGKGGKDIPVEEAEDHVFGYTVANDMSAREVQVGGFQYFRGKSLDGFCPLGPVVATKRSVPNPYTTYIKTWVNGELRQDWIVGDMLFKIDKLISDLSQGMTIEPGDIIICGTVPGTGFESMPQMWLQHGDRVETEITRIGRLHNTIKQREALA